MSPRVALHREVFVHRADDGALGHGDHGVQRIFWNGSAAGDGRQAAAAPCAQAMIDLVAEEIGAIAPAARGDAFGKHLENLVEIALG